MVFQDALILSWGGKHSSIYSTILHGEPTVNHAAEQRAIVATAPHAFRFEPNGGKLPYDAPAWHKGQRNELLLQDISTETPRSPGKSLPSSTTRVSTLPLPPPVTALLPPRPRPRRALALPALPFPPFVGLVTLPERSRHMAIAYRGDARLCLLEGLQAPLAPAW